MATPADKHERIKHLLSSYYGTGGGAAAATAPPTAAGSAPAAGQQPPTSPSAAAAAAAGGGSAAPGVPSPPPPPAAALVPGAALDAPGFDAAAHVAALVRGCGAARLLAEHRAMARDIRALDGDMQQLVYENYARFVGAADTIRGMRARAAGLGGDVERLAASMDAVARQSAAVNEKLLRRRRAMGELAEVQGALARLQAVVELPARMSAALGGGDLGGAVALYAEARPLLRKHGQRRALRGVAAAADAAAQDIAASLKRRLAERKDDGGGGGGDDGDDTEKLVLLLRKLGEGDDALQERYLAGRSARAARILAEAGAVADAMAAAARGEAPAPPPAALESPETWGFSAPAGGGDGGGGAMLPPSAPRFVRALDERLVSALRETVANAGAIFLAGDTAPARRRPLVAAAKEALTAYFVLVRRVVGVAAAAEATAAAGPELSSSSSSPAADFSAALQALAGLGEAGWGAGLVVQAMSTLSADVGLLHAQLPELSLREWAAATIELVAREHVAAAFGALEARVSAAVALLQEQLAAAAAAAAADGQPAEEQQQQQQQQQQEEALARLLPAACAYLCDLLQRGVVSLLRGLRPYEQARLFAAWREQLADVVQGHVAALFRHAAARFAAAAAPSTAAAATMPQPRFAVVQAAAAAAAAVPAVPHQHPPSPPAPALALALAKVLLQLEAAAVPAVMEALPTGGGGGGGSGGGGPPLFVGGDVARRLGAAAGALLAGYVELRGGRLSRLVADSFADVAGWGQAAAPPTAPRPVCAAFAEQLARAEAEVAALVDATGRPQQQPPLHHQPAQHQQHHHHRGGSAGESHAASAGLLAGGGALVERGVARLFRPAGGAAGGAPSWAGGGGAAPAFTQSALLGAVAAVGLRSLVEHVRLSTLGRHGLQQLQLDVAALRPRLLRPLGGADADAVARLADEAAASAAERCADPAALLEPAALERLLRPPAGGGGGGEQQQQHDSAPAAAAT